MAYPKCNILVSVVYLSVVHSFPVAEPIVPAIVLAAEPVVPSTEPTTEPTTDLTAKPGHMAVSKAVSKGQTILLSLLRHGKP